MLRARRSRSWRRSACPRRPRLAARVALVREEDDLDRVPARRGSVEHAAELELDREVGWRGVRGEQRVPSRGSGPSGRRAPARASSRRIRSARPRARRRARSSGKGGAPRDRPSSRCDPVPIVLFPQAEQRRCGRLRVAQRAAGGVWTRRRSGTAVADQVEALGTAEVLEHELEARAVRIGVRVVGARPRGQVALARNASVNGGARERLGVGAPRSPAGRPRSRSARCSGSRP